MTVSTEEIEEAVFDGVTLPIEQEGPDGENPWRLVDQRTEGNASPSRILVTDSGDSDGLGCAALLTHKFDSDITVLPASYRNWGYSPTEVLKQILLTVDEQAEIFITDLGQSESNKAEWFDVLWKLHDAGHTIRIRDHHENPEDFIKNANKLENVQYNHEPEMCATMNVLQHDYADAPEHLQTLAEYTNVRDLFLTDDERFEETELLSNAAFWFPVDYYINAAAEYGISLMDDPEWGDYVSQRTQIKSEKLNRVMETKSFYDHEGARWGFVYGDCYHSEAGRRLLEEDNADIAVIVKPSGKLSFRTDDEYPVANTLAAQFGGGGHDCAAGAGDYFDSPNLWESEPIADIRKEIFDIAESVL